MNHPIKLYVTSRRHQPKTTEIKQHEIEVGPATINDENVIRFISWIYGWNFINVEGFPQISKSDVLSEIQSFIEENGSASLVGETVDTHLQEFVKSLLSSFSSAIESCTSFMTKPEENPTLPNHFVMSMPPTTLFEIYDKMSITTDYRSFIPQTSHNLLTQELEYYQTTKNFRNYTGILTGAYLKMRRMLVEEPNADLNYIFKESMEHGYEMNFNSNNNNKYLVILKANIADYIDAMENAIKFKYGFQIIQKNLLHNFPKNYLYYLLLQNIKSLELATTTEVLHQVIDNILEKSANFLSCLYEGDDSMRDDLKNTHVIQPLSNMVDTLDVIHRGLIKYNKLEMSHLGCPYGMVDLTSATLFQIILYLMCNGIDSSKTIALCIHSFGSILVDLFYQRIITNVWHKDNPTDIHIKNVISKYNVVYRKYNINSLNELMTQKGRQYNIEIQELCKEFGEEYYDFLLTFRFGIEERHRYNMEAFARKINSQLAADESKTLLNVSTFGSDILTRLNEVILKHQSNDSVCLYGREIIEAVISSNGIKEFLKTYQNGTLYSYVLPAFTSDGC